MTALADEGLSSELTQTSACLIDSAETPSILEAARHSYASLLADVVEQPSAGVVQKVQDQLKALRTTVVPAE
jgi:hypothetical protein